MDNMNEREQEIAEEYASSLSDLNFNSKPLINMLTILADEYRDHAAVIVRTVEHHLLKVRSEVKLPVLYLIDSIVKNIGIKYTQLFKQNIAAIFCAVFEKVDEKIRANMFKLRSTWADVFPNETLHQLDVGVNKIDPAWPIAAKPVPVKVNTAADIKDTLLQKQKELLELQHKKLQLELMQTKKRLEEQEKQSKKQAPQDSIKSLFPQLKGDVLELLTSEKDDPEQAKLLKAKLAQLTAMVAAKAAAESSTPPVREPIESSQVSSTSHSPSSSKVSKSSTSSKKSSGDVRIVIPPTSSKVSSLPAATTPSKVQAAPFVNPFNKHTTSSSAPEVAAPPARVAINPVSSDLLSAVAAGRRSGAIRDPRLRREEQTEPARTVVPPSKITEVLPSSTTRTVKNLTVTLNCGSSSNQDKPKKQERERKSSYSSNELKDDLFGDENSHSKSKHKSSNRSKDVPTSHSPKKSSKESSQEKKPSSDKYKQLTNSPSKSRDRHSDRKSDRSDRPHSRNEDSSSESKHKSSRSEKDKIRDKSEKSDKRKKSPEVLKSFNSRLALPSPQDELNDATVDDIIRLKHKSKSRSDKEKVDTAKSKDNHHEKEKKLLELQQKRLEDQLKANALTLKTLQSAEDKKREKEDSNIDDQTFDSIIRMRKVVKPVKTKELDTMTESKMEVDEEESKENDIIRMKNESKRSRPSKVEEPKPSDAEPMEVEEESVREAMEEEEEISPLQEVAVDEKVEEVKKVSPARPRLKIKNFALLASTPCEELEEISEDELVTDEKLAMNTVPITGEDESDIYQVNEEDEEAPFDPEVSSKFKEVKASSLKRLRQYVRNREKRTPTPPSIRNEVKLKSNETLQNNLVVAPTGDVDLRPLLMTKTDEPPEKKSKVADSLELFGVQDVDLRSSLPAGKLEISPSSKMPSPPPPPIISHLEDKKSVVEPKKSEEGEKKPTLGRIRVKMFSELEKTIDAAPEVEDTSKNYDTDMRYSFVKQPTPAPSTPSRNVKAIVKQAEIDLKNGSISFSDYSNILKRLANQAETSPVEEKRAPLTSSNNLNHGEVPPPPMPPSDLLDVSPLPTGVDNILDIPPKPPKDLLDVSLLESDPTVSNTPVVSNSQLVTSSSQIPPHTQSQTQSILHPPLLQQQGMIGSGPPGLISQQFPMGNPRLGLPFGLPPRPDFIPPGVTMPLNPLMPPMPIPGTNMPPFVPHPTQFQSFGGLQPADPEVLRSIMLDQMKSIKIDNIPREIRFYGHIGIVFLSYDDPREIGFMKGVRKVIFDEKIKVACKLNGSPKFFVIDGHKHSIRLGNPTRELYIDDDFYECCFGGAPLCVTINGKKHLVQLEGPPPTVSIDTKKRTDLCAGRVDLYIDKKLHVPMYLDCKPHKVDIDGFPYILRFVEALRVLVINGTPFNINFGGPPMTIALHDKNHTFEFSPLPPGVRQGYVNILHMDGGRLPTPPPEETPPQHFKTTVPQFLDENSGPGDSDIVGLGKNDQGIPFISEEINVNELFDKLVALGALPPTKPAEDEHTLKDISWHSEHMKERQPAMIHMLYSGIQCGSCGCRFPPDQTTKYSLHLDWHFRINRKERDLGRTVQSRKFYYSHQEWCSYYEIEDEENKGQSWFEIQQEAQLDAMADELVEVPSCKAELDEVEPRCGVCRDRFEQFYNEEIEEWQLRNAIRIDGQAFHPICHQDHLNSIFSKQSEEPLEDDQYNEGEDTMIPDDAEEFARPIPVGVYTLEDDPDDEPLGEFSVQIIEPEPDIDPEAIKIENIKNEHIQLEMKSEDTLKQEKLDNIEESEPNQDQIMEQNIEEPIENMDNIPEDVNENDNAVIDDKNEPMEEEEKEHEEEEPILDSVIEDEEPHHEKEIINEDIPVISTNIECSIDGNESTKSKQTNIVPSKIKININKSLGNKIRSSTPPNEVIINENTSSPKMMSPRQDENSQDSTISNSNSDSNNILNYPKTIKPTILNKKLTQYPTHSKGKELSALCSIM